MIQIVWLPNCSWNEYNAFTNHLNKINFWKRLWMFPFYLSIYDLVHVWTINLVQLATLSDGEIVEMILFPVLNEACRMISEAIIVKSSDLDVASVLGMGFPGYRYFCLEIIFALAVIHTLIVYVDENQGRHNFLVSLCWLQIYLFKTGRMVEGVWRVFQALCILSRTSFQEKFFGEKC